MNPHYGINTSVFVRLLTGDPEPAYLAMVERFEQRLKSEPAARFLVSNQVIGEAYIALQYHYGVGKIEARAALCSVLTSGLCTPLNGAGVLTALQTNQGCGLLDRLIADDYAARGIKVLTNDLKMSKLPGAERL